MTKTTTYSGAGPIPKAKPKLADTFSQVLTDTVTDTEKIFSRENLVTESMK